MTEVEKHCCEEMTRRVNQRCEMHADVFECADNLIYYSADSNSYGIIIHDGGSSFSVIAYCPWCGTKLPEPVR
jgi:hypothetical protein